jgi:hypothetical protein
MSVIDSSCYLNKTVLFSANIVVDYIVEKILTNLDGQIQINEGKKKGKGKVVPMLN